MLRQSNFFFCCDLRDERHLFPFVFRQPQVFTAQPGSKEITHCLLDIDLHRNEPRVIKLEKLPNDGSVNPDETAIVQELCQGREETFKPGQPLPPNWHGTQVAVVILGKFARGMQLSESICGFYESTLSTRHLITLSVSISQALARIGGRSWTICGGWPSSRPTPSCFFSTTTATASAPSTTAKSSTHGPSPTPVICPVWRQSF